MPYITQEAKERLDHGHTADNVGELTYELTRTVQQYLEKHGLRYQQIAEIKGAFEGALSDFHDRVVMPYEAVKAAENGDVWSHLKDIFPGLIS